MNRLRTQLVLVAAAIIFFGGTAYGMKLLTKPANPTSDAPTCDARTVNSGDDLTTNLITVNVYNASQVSGRANRVNINLQRNGFLGGQAGNANDILTGNAPSNTVVIVTADKNDPQVKLVAAQFKDKVTYAAPQKDLAKGVSIVVGDNYDGLAKKPPRSVKSDRTLNFCLPIVTVS